jgi:hypothetical protein
LLIPAFDNIDDRTRREDPFYGLREWREGPRHAVLDCIVTYTGAAFELPDDLVEGLRRSLARGT